MVYTKTGSLGSSETDDNIFINIEGDPCSTGFKYLDVLRRDDFEWNRLDSFIVETPFIVSVSHCFVIVYNNV